MKWIPLLIYLMPTITWACLPNEIHIRQQWIKSYIKQDGKSVAAHIRSEHCREITSNNYFQNSSKMNLKALRLNLDHGIKTKKLKY